MKSKPKPKPRKPSSETQSRVTLELEKLRDKREGKNKENVALRERVLVLERELDALTDLQARTPQFVKVPAKMCSGKSESAAVLLWSDWHIEEPVRPETVGGKNEYNLKIADQRFQNLLDGSLAWLNIESQRTRIKTLVLALLGDFISGSIHDELMESNLLLPTDAIFKAQNMLMTGIRFLLKNTPRDLKIVVVCHSGNHGRMTKKQRVSTEAGNSLERFMYLNLRDIFAGNRRVEFIVPEGYHSFVEFFDGAYTVRFHHGHAIRYGGGIGGITIPVNKAIAQWNKARHADLDCFGHFHQKFDGGNFLANGSMIGYNAYAVSIKASFEKPSQTFFLINKRHCAKTMVAPIFV